MTVGGDLPRLAEGLSDGLLRFADPLREQLRAAHGDEVRVGLVGDGLRHQRLSGSRRAVQQDAGGRVDAQPIEPLGVRERPLDGLLDLVFGVLQAADVVPGYLRKFDEDLPHRARFDLVERPAEVRPLDDHPINQARRDILLVEIDLGR